MICIFSKSHTSPLLYSSPLTHSRTASSLSALISMQLPVISGCSPSLGCADKVAPPNTTSPDSRCGLSFSRCLGRTARRFCSELGWSGIMTSYSFLWDMVEVEESLGLDEARKEEEEEEEEKEEEGVVGIRRSGGTKRHAGARRRDLAVMISRLRTEGKSNRCIEKEGPDITHLLYLRLQVPLLLGKRKCTATSPTWLSQG